MLFFPIYDLLVFIKLNILFLVNLMSMGSAIAFAWTSPCLPKLNDNENQQNNPLPRPTTALEDSWITSLHSLGAASCPLFAGITANKFGRKKTLLVFSLPMIVSNLMLTFANTVTLFYIARFLVGLGTGCVFSVIPLYVAEISEVTNRGFVSMFLGLMFTLAQLCLYIIGPFISIRTLAIISLIPLMLFIVTFGLFIPESPYFLILHNDYSAAEKSLAKLRQTSQYYVQKELAEIIKSIEQSKTEKPSIKKLVKSKTVRKSMFIIVGLMLFQQFTGILAIMPYLQTIFDATKTSLPGYISVMIVGCVQFITVTVTSAVIDRINRKKLLMTSNIGILLSLTSLGTFFYLQSQQFDLGSLFWLPIISVIFFIISFNFGIGPLPWTIAGEIFPSNLKTYLNGITTVLNISFGFITAMFFPSLSMILGMAWTIWMFAFCTAVSLIFIRYCVPETRGRTFLEIQLMLKEGSKTHRINAECHKV